MVRTMLRSIHSFFRVNFFAGFFVAVPFAITIAALIWVWGKIQQPLAHFFSAALTPGDKYPWSDIFTAIEKSDARFLLVPLISLALLLFCVLLLGILARSIFGRVLLSGVEGLVERLPLVGVLYKSLKQLSEAFVSADGKSKFQRAVAVQFPQKGCWAIGFVTGRGATFVPPHPELFPLAGSTEILTVFVPTSPLPTAGFMLLVPEKETIELDISVQDALKLVVSGGMLDSQESARARKPSKLSQVIDEKIEASRVPGNGGASSRT